MPSVTSEQQLPEADDPRQSEIGEDGAFGRERGGARRPHGGFALRKRVLDGSARVAGWRRSGRGRSARGSGEKALRGGRGEGLIGGVGRAACTAPYAGSYRGGSIPLGVRPHSSPQGPGES
jgi:hypothetical protein